MVFVQVIVASSLLATLVAAEDFARFSEALPSAVDAKSIAPVFDFDGDGCLPAAGMSTNGVQNAGLKTSGKITGDCRTSNFLDQSNSYHRYACSSLATDGKKYCGHFYALYFEKDQLFDYFGGGHRHDWENAVIWTTNGVITHASASAHGDLDTRAVSGLDLQNGKVKIVYHKDGVTTHALRFAKTNEVAENAYGTFVTPTIISWFEFKSSTKTNAQLRSLLSGFDYGSAHFPNLDGDFLNDLNEWKPSSYPNFANADIFSPNTASSLVEEDVSAMDYTVNEIRDAIEPGSYQVGPIVAVVAVLALALTAVAFAAVKIVRRARHSKTPAEPIETLTQLKEDNELSGIITRESKKHVIMVQMDAENPLQEPSL